LGPWPSPDRQAQARQQLQSYISAPTFATFEEAHQAVSQGRAGANRIMRVDYPQNENIPSSPAGQRVYAVVPAEQEDQVEGLPLSSLPGPVRTPAGAPTAMMSDPVDVDADPEVTREVVDV
jgi:hypothetical protein